VSAILDQIYETKTVTDGQHIYSAMNPAGLPTFMDREEGELLGRVIRQIQPQASLEIGFAYGVSTLYICEALSNLPQPAKHFVIDPYQRNKWHGVGLHNVAAAGYEHLVTFIDARSELALPRLLEEGVQLDFALIDGLHTFEQCAVEFFYIDRLLNAGGAIVFDDADWPGINKVVRLALSYGNYTPIGQSGAITRSRSFLGSLRTSLRNLPFADRVVRRDVLYRPWDLAVAGTCVALQKTAAGDRPNGWYQDF
jgi:predicted O-methyltransferase YrrM